MSRCKWGFWCAGLVLFCLGSGSDAFGQACSVGFETGDCPTVAAPICGAAFDGLGCRTAFTPGCYAAGLESYEVTPVAPLTITMPDGIISLSVFFAHQSLAGGGTMQFFDAVTGGSAVDSSISTNGQCSALNMPPTQSFEFSSVVRRIEVTSVDGSVWIDSFSTVAAPPVPTVSEWGLVALSLSVLCVGSVLVVRRRRNLAVA